jgi:hypothetical protein
MHAVVMMAVSAAAARRRSMPSTLALVALRKWMVERYGSQLGMGECTAGMQRRPHHAQAVIHQKCATT